MLGHFSRGLKRLFALSLLASALATVLNFLTPQVIRLTVDSVIGDKPVALPAFLQRAFAAIQTSPLQDSLLACAAMVLLLALAGGVCTYFSRTLTAKGSEGFIKRLRDALYAHIQRLPYQWHVKNQTGDIIQRCTSDVEVVRNFVTNQMLEVFRTTFLVVFALAIMFSMNVKMSLAALAFIPIVMAYSGFFYAKISKRFRVADEAEGSLSATVQENLTGVRVVRAFGREQFEVDRFDEKNNRFSSLWIRLGYVLGSYWGIGDLFTGLQILLVIVLGTVETVNGNITLGEFLVFISYNSTLVWPIRGLGRILSEMSKAGISMDRIGYILNEPEESDPPDALTPALAGDIVFDHVSFQYGSAKPVLQDISFTIPRGTTFAILGGTGSGKSTLMHLLDRLYDLPDGCGRITIGGVDIKDISRSHLRSQIGMVLQEPYLFSRSIAENIRAPRPEAPQEEIRFAARIASVDDAISEFESGYDTIVGERGVTLSGGQKQRVAIARMLMQRAPIMVFDDSLSAVDSETDAKIRAALHRETGESTVILISHRITTLMRADRILVLDGGKVAQLGTHEQLIATPGIYKDIYDIQMSSADKLQMGPSSERPVGKEVH